MPGSKTDLSRSRLTGLASDLRLLRLATPRAPPPSTFETTDPHLIEFATPGTWNDNNLADELSHSRKMAYNDSDRRADYKHVDDKLAEETATLEIALGNLPGGRPRARSP